MIRTSIKCNDWIATGVDVTVVEDGYRHIIGRDLFSKLGFSLTQLKQVANIDQNQCLIKKQIEFDFPDLITRIGKSLTHSVKSTFHKQFTPTFHISQTFHKSNPHFTNSLHLHIKKDDESQLIYNH